MRVLRGVLLGMAVVTLCGAGRAPVALVQPFYVIDVFPLSSITSSGIGEFGVALSALPGSGGVVDVEILASPPLRIVSADSRYQLPVVGVIPPRRLLITGMDTTFQVLRARGIFRRGSEERAVVEIAVPIRLLGDSLVVGQRRIYRSEFVEAGQRFRKSAGWFVPIDGPEEIDPADALAEPSSAVAMASDSAGCADCSRAADEGRFLVVIDRAGVIRDAYRLGGRGLVAVDASASAALSRQRFTPAHVGRTPVTSCLIVTMPAR